MSLRDFNNAPFPNDPHALHNEPLGNGAGLDSFHTVQPEDIEPNNTPKIIGGIAVALMIGVAGIALYASSGSHPQAVVATNTLPPAPIAQPAPTPAPAAMAPDADTSVTPSAAADKAADNSPAPAAPVKTASLPKKHSVASDTSSDAVKESPKQSASANADNAASARMAADSSQSTAQPQQQQAVSEPTPPSPSPSDVATNNTQSGVSVPQNATTASDMAGAQQPQQQSQPQAQPPAAAPAPAPEQSAGQVNQ